MNYEVLGPKELRSIALALGQYISTGEEKSCIAFS